MATKPRIRVKARSQIAAVDNALVGTQRMSGPRVVTMFDAGRSERRLRSVPTAAQAINTQIRRYGRTIVARSRYLCNNNPYASAAKDIFTSALVGCGIKPSPLIDDKTIKAELQIVHNEWCDEADADGLTDYYGLQELLGAEMFEAGEVFVRFRERRPEDGLLVPLQLQVMPSEMLPLDDNRELANGRRVEMGIQFDPIGRREGYHFWKYHPYSDVGTRYEKVFVPASEILHLFKPRIVGQLRGIPHTISAIAKLAMMDQYDDAELERKRTAALFAGIVTRKAAEVDEDHPLELASTIPGTIAEDGSVLAPSSGPLFEESVSGLGYGLEPGAMIDLAEGEDIKFSEPADVGGNYEVFQYRTLLSIAAGFGVPYAAMTGDLRQANYGSIRAGLIDFRRRVEAMQHNVMVYQFCRPVRARWLSSAVLAGALESVTPTDYQLRTRDLLRVKWIPPKWEWVDPYKDRQAEKLAVDNGFKSRSDVQEAEGYDPEETDARIAADQERADKLELRLAAPASPGAAATPSDAEDDPAADDPAEDDPNPDDPPQPATPYALHVHLPKPGKERTIITRFDDKGRVLEMEKEPVE